MITEIIRDIARIVQMPKVDVSLGEGPGAENVIGIFNAVHPRYRIIRRKTLGACLLKLSAFKSFEEFLESVNGKNSPAYYRRKAMKLGYHFEEIDPNRYIDDIFEVNTSKDERQGKPMSAEYRVKPERYEVEPGWSYFGVLDQSGRLRAYLFVRHQGEVSYVGPVLGHGSFLNDGVMYQIFLDAVRVLFARGTKYFMYDMYFGAPEGLRKFKEKLGFIPHKVKWRLGASAQ